ncbi:LysR family transcriptional regulator [Pseudoalteromonas luteoviolacea]|uniref:LysR family transcriptional regulator n=1 Tax=Pseudoalteromonas luteoviolacea TaxID=43657 RepID=UPI001F41A7B9|nr:LysR family transcriptional regulator [Pseudoalteromonas luteoviolacea]MCF6439815.1 LysR family transcriptional regulator [Pseudoalteromonas luteoviolacea]
MTRYNQDEGLLGLYSTFVTTAQAGSFVTAAQLLELSPSTLGRRIKKLESVLKTQLFTRTTRQVNITEAGQRYLEAYSGVLSQLDSIEQDMASENSEPRGTLRVSIPNTFGRLHISPYLGEFLRCYPKLKLELIQKDNFEDLMQQNIDVAIRIGTLSNSSLRAKRIAPNIRRLVASPDYLAQAGVPQWPADIQNHQCLHFSHLSQGKKWQLTKDKVTRKVEITPTLMCDDASALLAAALDGSGIALLADFITYSHLQKGTLVEVLPQWKLNQSDIYAVYPNTGFLAQKSRVFIDFFAQKISAALML